jgi:hypothetical protein
MAMKMEKTIEERSWPDRGESAVPSERSTAGLGGREWRAEAPRPGEELASYRVSAGERILLCAYGIGGLEIHDVDASFVGTSYRVDHLLEDPIALGALIADYLHQAERLDAPPMSPQGDCRDDVPPRRLIDVLLWRAPGRSQRLRKCKLGPIRNPSECQLTE